jgi:hypothetical protein
MWLNESGCVWTTAAVGSQLGFQFGHSSPGEPARILAQLGTSFAAAEVTFWLGLVLNACSPAIWSNALQPT